jgi:hypothetical protein
MIKPGLRAFPIFKVLLEAAENEESVDLQATTRQHALACARHSNAFVNSVQQALECTDATE